MSYLSDITVGDIRRASDEVIEELANKLKTEQKMREHLTFRCALERQDSMGVATDRVGGHNALQFCINESSNPATRYYMTSVDDARKLRDKLDMFIALCEER